MALRCCTCRSDEQIVEFGNVVLEIVRHEREGAVVSVALNHEESRASLLSRRRQFLQVFVKVEVVSGDKKLLVTIAIGVIGILFGFRNQAFDQAEHEEDVIAVQA